jgi:hypothetical protein
MTFESRVTAFADRFLSDRTFQLIVAPALADLHYAPGTERLSRVVNRLAVLRAVAGAVRADASGVVGTFVFLTLVPACYYAFLLVLWMDFFTTASGYITAATLILVLSVGPVAVCFWPRRTVRPVD